MNVPVTGTIKPCDRALWVDMQGDSEISSRCVASGKLTLAQQKTVNCEAGPVQIKTNDVASRVDSIRSGKQRSRHIDCGEVHWC